MKILIFSVFTISLASMPNIAQADFSIEPTKVSANCEGRSNDELMIRHSGTGRIIYKTTRYYGGIESCRKEASNLNVMFNAAAVVGMKIKMKNGNSPASDIKIDSANDKLLLSPLKLSAFCGGQSGDNLMVRVNGYTIYRTSRYWTGISGCQADAEKLSSKINAAVAVGKLMAFSLNNSPDSDFEVSDSDDPKNRMNQARSIQDNSTNESQESSAISAE